ncbi:uncharacterized protein BJX67DRAFT_89755 [Aspergillus lucknowensis]|uniref:Uncharacterized protein n=1 Tax=Aspergillus lucknowensis TaxID=176173 RepID=A0ABR4M5I2_9EURO
MSRCIRVSCRLSTQQTQKGARGPLTIYTILLLSCDKYGVEGNSYWALKPRLILLVYYMPVDRFIIILCEALAFGSLRRLPRPSNGRLFPQSREKAVSQVDLLQVQSTQTNIVPSDFGGWVVDGVQQTTAKTTEEDPTSKNKGTGNRRRKNGRGSLWEHRVLVFQENRGSQHSKQLAQLGPKIHVYDLENSDRRSTSQKLSFVVALLRRLKQDIGRLLGSDSSEFEVETPITKLGLSKGPRSQGQEPRLRQHCEASPWPLYSRRGDMYRSPVERVLRRVEAMRVVISKRLSSNQLLIILLAPFCLLACLGIENPKQPY